MLLAPLVPSEIKKGRVDAINPGHIPVLSIRRSHFPGRLSQKERKRIEYEKATHLGPERGLGLDSYKNYTRLYPLRRQVCSVGRSLICFQCSRNSIWKESKVGARAVEQGKKVSPLLFTIVLSISLSLCSF